MVEHKSIINDSVKSIRAIRLASIGADDEADDEVNKEDDEAEEWPTICALLSILR